MIKPCLTTPNAIKSRSLIFTAFDPRPVFNFSGLSLLRSYFQCFLMLRQVPSGRPDLREFSITGDGLLTSSFIGKFGAFRYFFQYPQKQFVLVENDVVSTRKHNKLVILKSTYVFEFLSNVIG